MKSVFTVVDNEMIPRSEYPRPQMVRDSYFCLNGEWRFEVNRRADLAEGYSERILVPFAPESELSRIHRKIGKGEYLHYKKVFALPEGFNQGRVILHFDAVDQVASVVVNGTALLRHEGGYLPFSCDITDVLKKENILEVHVYDDADNDVYPRGKQNNNPSGIWYTATSGIWGSVWIESVPCPFVESLKITPEFDKSSIKLKVLSKNCNDFAVVSVHYGDKKVCSKKIECNKEEIIELNGEIHPWSPEAPQLYGLTVRLGKDKVESYFALRKFSIVDYKGKKAIGLNNRPYFLNGVLDQGYWPESGLTAPTDKALIKDIEDMKELGFNMLRKHIKVEPLRFYYHCDRLGMVVCQDILNAGAKYKDFLIYTCPFIRWKVNDRKSYKLLGRGNQASRDFFEKELPLYVEHLYNSPSIACWTLFNEGWGQFDSVRLTETLKSYDATRLIDSTSGWFDQGAGDFNSRHIYFRKPKAKGDGKRVFAITEFGGFVNPIPGHRSGEGEGIHYPKAKEKDLTDRLIDVFEDTLLPLIEKEGLSLTVYTQLSDVEEEENGLYTYDRAICKVDKDRVKTTFAKMRFHND